MPSNLPPGVTNRMIDEAAGVFDICQCCGNVVDNCICPECPTCSEFGNPKCYEDVGGHGLQFSMLQQLGQAKLRLAQLREQVQEVEQFVQQLEEQAEAEGGDIQLR